MGVEGRLAVVFVQNVGMMRLVQTLACVALVGVGCASAVADAFVGSVRARCEGILQRAAEPGGLAGAVADAEEVADLVAGRASDGQLGALGWTEGCLRLLWTAQSARMDGIGALGSQPEFCVELGLLVVADNDPGGVMRLAGRLAEERGEAVRLYPALAAALCVVHDRPFWRRINENRVDAPDPLAIFDYFVRNARAMRLDPARTPALLLVHVVDVTERIDQLEWALGAYGRDPSPGERFFEIRYDHDAFRKGTVKKVTEAGDYRLESIKRHGGVCADQAYFAETVGKAAGVPTCYVSARGADVSHAWIGYLGTRGRPAWDFSRGRYEAYQNLRGEVTSPQTRRRIPDAEVGLLGGLLLSSADDIRGAMGAAMAARRMAPRTSPRPMARRAAFVAPDAVDGVLMTGTRRVARTGAIGDRLGLLRAALTRCAWVPDAWAAVAEFGAAGEMSPGELDEWARAVDRICGTTQQDFSFDMLVRLIGSERDAQTRHRMWDWAFARYRARPDLASGARFQQGRMWDREGRPELAWAAYEDVLNNFLNDGPMAVQALRSMRDLLDKNGKRDSFLAYVEDAARLVRAPGQMGSAFASQSNHYRIHAMLADELDRRGRGAEARRVRERVGIGEP